MQFEPRFPAGFGEFGQEVAAERRAVLYVVVGRGRAAPKREAVVVARGDADVAGAGVLEGLHPGAGVEADGIKGRREFAVFAVVEVLVRHDPFALSEHAVEAEMQENAELMVGERFAGFQVFGRGRIDVGRVDDGCRFCCGGWRFTGAEHAVPQEEHAQEQSGKNFHIPFVLNHVVEKLGKVLQQTYEYFT